MNNSFHSNVEINLDLIETREILDKGIRQHIINMYLPFQNIVEY